MIGIVYKAVDELTGKTVKVGSTVKSLNSRAQDKCYEGCVLIPIRIDEYDDDSGFGTLLLRTRELFEISKNHTWHDGGSGCKNILNPVRVWLSHLDDFDMRSYAGKIGGAKAFKLHGNPGTKEGSSKAGKVAGQKNVESGWASELGKKYGGKVFEHLADFRTIEHQREAGKKGGKIGGKLGGRTNVLSGHCARIARLGGLVGGKNPKGRHVRWHVNRGLVNPQCSLCGVNNA